MKKLISILSILILLIASTSFISIYNTNSNTNKTNTIVSTCNIITNYDNMVVIEYKGNTYKCFVHDGNIYNKLTKAKIIFNTNNISDLKSYRIIDIAPV